MNIIENNGNIILEQVSDFELDNIFDCGQCFRWDKVSESSYIGIACGRVLLVEKASDRIILHSTNTEDFWNIWCKYFDLDRDYSDIKRSLSKDNVLKEAIGFGKGIRILNQEPFETLVSFIISASNNIPRIKGIISRLCENFGDEILYMGKTYYTFPSAERLASETVESLSVIRAGFRDKYIIDAAKKVASGYLQLDSIRLMPTADAKSELMKIKGVGSKVADCALLFGFGKCDCFPTDVWIKRIMEHCYFDGNDTSLKNISAYAQNNFGGLGGFAQQYLFYWARENKIGV
ncbi:MAG: 8-oxoguanine DNA glycosylase [Clostridia bacterium]|nr:8-oxoguanine DNA glycosylase [Clostridia bacterium]